MPAAPILRDVFHALRAEWGEEDDGVTFDGGPPPLERLDVMLYRPARPDGVTAFATVGMAAHPMPPGGGRPGGGAGGRAELRLLRRGPLGREDEHRLATRLANLAAYPWTRGVPLGPGEIVGFDDELPAFPGCRRVFLAGPWPGGGPGVVETRVEPVRVLTAVPLAEAERARALALPPETFFAELLRSRDVCAPPPDGR
ncbi:suppressor of fused domain protein [Streptomyces albus]|uniref:Suppressor of fused domain protein n=1 Tax=Streptomyces albus TaxID=1888 RepID=A0A8H1LH54_9ACTN|nr:MULTISPECIES: suppressor of fused domain protein [Streptomyces]EPD95660.1 hypothetical protein HMPREF1486_01857 [Streptomyces sp. HPH0547]MDI6407866.1 suppressor of fused domain protein [Streptomyces albus]TGG83242.1 suppressor of fused domain protein [Streptomyces albus]UVN57019.1 suppressor of fused domain protein [Streptomyces albus]GHJ21736.1 hypothetical protein TPA0909_33500 [Streptomyces albus]